MILKNKIIYNFNQGSNDDCFLDFYLRILRNYIKLLYKNNLVYDIMSKNK